MKWREDLGYLGYDIERNLVILTKNSDEKFKFEVLNEDGLYYSDSTDYQNKMAEIEMETWEYD